MRNFVRRFRLSTLLNEKMSGERACLKRLNAYFSVELKKCCILHHFSKSRALEDHRTGIPVLHNFCQTIELRLCLLLNRRIA
jgi:hypothetical protein